MAPNPIGNDARRATRSRRLPLGACCFFCGINYRAVLKVHVLDEHHPLTKRLAPMLTVVLCRNHHDLVHEDLREHGAELHRPPGAVLDDIQLILVTTARFLIMLGEALMDWSRLLENFIASLDVNWPAWRELPEATP